MGEHAPRLPYAVTFASAENQTAMPLYLESSALATVIGYHPQG